MKLQSGDKSVKKNQSFVVKQKKNTKRLSDLVELSFLGSSLFSIVDIGIDAIASRLQHTMNYCHVLVTGIGAGDGVARGGSARENKKWGLNLEG